MDENTKAALREIYGAQLATAEDELAAIACSAQEFGRGRFAEWEDLRPREIARLEATIAEYGALLTEVE